MRVEFPYPASYVDIPDDNLLGVYAAPQISPSCCVQSIVRRALDQPIGTPRLRDMAKGVSSVLVVCDDVSRPTPSHQIVPEVLKELHAAGVTDEQVEFMMALGTHRPMTQGEMAAKVGPDVYAMYPVHNHEWDNRDAMHYLGTVRQGIEVWVNKRVAQADLVIGIGRIMPIEVCGFTGGGKILIPGCCGEITNSEMHWLRAEVEGKQIVGHRDNPIRAAIDSLARKAGLDFIVNVVMNAQGCIVACVTGDLVEAHRVGVKHARACHQVTIPREADIVIVDGYPFDIEFWQVNKAVDAAGLVVRSGGAVICVSPCYEGISRTHAEVVLKYGYRTRGEIKELVASGQIEHKVVGVHMMQVSEVAREKASLYLVTDGISEDDVRRLGLNYAATPQDALDQCLAALGTEAQVVVLRRAAEMLPFVERAIEREW